MQIFLNEYIYNVCIDIFDCYLYSLILFVDNSNRFELYTKFQLN